MLKDKLNKIIGGGIAKKFIIWTVAIIVLLDILAANFMLSDLDKTLSEQLNGRGRLLARHLADESGGSLLNEDAGNLSQLAENIKKADSDVKYVYITDAQNNVIAHASSNGFLPPNADGNSSFYTTEGNVVDFEAQILGRGGFARVGMDRTSINEKINNQTHIIIANILAEGALGFLMAYIAGIYLTRPIRSLVKGAQEIGRGNLGYKIETGSSDDEIQTLSNAFNQMSYNLSENISEIRKLSTAVEEAPDGIRITDMDGYIIYSNKASEKILGFSPEELKGKHVTELNVDPDIGSKVILPAIKGSGRWTGELMQKHKDGKEIPIWLNASVIKDSKGEPIGMVGIIRDTTDLKEKEKLEVQLLQSNKLATVGQLAAGIAHEINNPLGNISLYTQMLLKKAKDKNTKDKLMIINDETNRAAQIVKGLLDFARQSELKLSPTDINKEIGKVLSMLTLQLKELSIENPQLKDIRITTDLQPLPLILADSGQIRQVTMNLLTNAVQSITEKGEIMVKTKTNKGHVEISISDNGSGIPGENLDKIFDPFFTTKEAGKGTGLGLSISYGIIKRHNGSIEVKSKAGKGTTFTIKLPA